MAPAVGEEMVVAVRMKEHAVNLLLVLERLLYLADQPVASPVMAIELQAVVQQNEY